MTYPLIALAGCTGLIGLICLVAGPFAGTTEWFAHHLHSTFGFESLGHFEHHFDWATAIMGTLAALGGNRAQLRALRQARGHRSRLPARLRPLYEASLNKFYVDEFYEWLIARPTRAFAVICDFVDAYFVDGLARGIAKIPRGLGRAVLARYQNGLIQFYAGASVLVCRGAPAGAPDSFTLNSWRRARRGLLDGDIAGDHGVASLDGEPGPGARAEAGIPDGPVDRACDCDRDPGLQPDLALGLSTPR